MIHSILYDWTGYNLVLFSKLNTLDLAGLNGLAWLLSHLIDFKLGWLYPLLLAMAVSSKNHWEGLTGFEGRAGERWALWTRFTACLVAASVITAVLKFGFDYPRPLDVLGGGVVRVVGTPQYGHSFPSGHAVLAGLFAGCFWSRVSRRGRWALALLVPLMMLSRIVVGAHFPADVLAGACIGLTMPLLISSRRAAHLLHFVRTWRMPDSNGGNVKRGSA